MQTALPLAVSLYQGQAIRTHVERLSLTESSFTKLPTRLVVQVQTSAVAAATLAQLASQLGSAGLAARAALLPVAVLGLETALALAARLSSKGGRAANIIDAVQHLMPKLTAGALVASTVAMALLQPLATAGLALHGLVALAERRQWVPAKAVTALLLASTVVGVGLGVAFGSPLIQAVLALEILAFVVRRLGAAQQRLGLVPPRGQEAVGQHQLRALRGRPLDEASRLAPMLPADLLHEAVGRAAGFQDQVRPSLWAMEPSDEPGVPLPQWGVQVQEIREQLIRAARRQPFPQLQRDFMQPLVDAIHDVQTAFRTLCEGIRRQDPAQELQTAKETLLGSMRTCSEHVRARGAREVPAQVNEFPVTLTMLIQQAIDARSAEGLTGLEQLINRRSVEIRRLAEGDDLSGLEGELELVAAELPHGRGSREAVLDAFIRLSERFERGDFGPGSLADPEIAQQGWGRCLRAIAEALHEDGLTPRREDVVLRALARLVLKANESCAGSLLCAIEECYDQVRGIDRLSEGFRGFLKQIKTEEAADWERSASSWLRGFFEWLADRGAPGAEGLRAWVGRPDASTAMAGAELLPWLDSSQRGALKLLRASQIAQQEVVILGQQLAMQPALRSGIETRLSQPGLLLDQAVQYLLSEEGRMAWHKALQDQDFRSWIVATGLVQQENLEHLAIPSHSELEELMMRESKSLGVQNNDILPHGLAAAALLLLAHSGLMVLPQD